MEAAIYIYLREVYFGKEERVGDRRWCGLWSKRDLKHKLVVMCLLSDTARYAVWTKLWQCPQYVEALEKSDSIATGPVNNDYGRS